MDSVIGIQFDGGVVLAADQANTYSIMVLQSNLDKIIPLTTRSCMAVSGPNCDMVNFTEYIAKNLQLYEWANDGAKLSIHAQAHFARQELAVALRKGPYQVNVLLGGYDDKVGPSLYFMDYLAALQKVKYGAQGYAQYFCWSVMDKEYRDGLKEDEAIKIVDQCIHELQTRFLPNQRNFIIKVVDKDGIRTVRSDADPKDN